MQHPGSFGRIFILAFLLPAAQPLVPSASAQSVSQVYSLPATSDAQHPVGELTYFNGAYYGLTLGDPVFQTSYGTIYRFDPATGSETTVYTFTNNRDGAFPVGTLIESGGLLYGAGNGLPDNPFLTSNIFSFDPATGTVSNVVSLSRYDKVTGNLAAYGKEIYAPVLNSGVTPAVVGIDPGTGTQPVVYQLPEGFGQPNGLLTHGKLLYGTTPIGPTQASSIFAFDPVKGSFRILHLFGGIGDGITAEGSLLGVDGILYGTTVDGGNQGRGTVFAYDPGSLKESVIHNFSGYDGVQPGPALDGSQPGPMLMSAGGLLYGVTQTGGANGLGVVFSIDPATDQENVLTSFTAAACTDFQGLTASGKRLLGVASYGGTGSVGCLYAVDQSTGQYASLHQFGGQAVDYASAPTTIGSVLYGTAEGGGTNALGVIYKYDPLTGTGAVIHTFNGADGGKPKGPLTAFGGLLYGTTTTGGGYNNGTIFSFDPKRQVLTTLYSFTGGDDGGAPSCRLAVVRDALFGALAGSGTKKDLGSVFELGLAHLQFRTVFKFTQTSGYIPVVDMTLANGILYGVTTAGGPQTAYNAGTLFSIDPATGAESTIYPFTTNGFSGQQASGLTYAGGALFGVNTGSPISPNNTVYEFHIGTQTEATKHRFHPLTYPIPLALTPVGDQFYGLANLQDGYQAIMRVDPANGVVTYDDLPTSPNVMPFSSLVRDRSNYFFTGYSDYSGTALALFELAHWSDVGSNTSQVH